MKKSLVLAILGAAAVTASSYGQGTLNFFNYFNSTSPTINYSANAALVPNGKAGLALGGSFAAELAWFNGTTADPAQLTLVPTSITGFSFNGPGLNNSTADGDVYNSTHPNGNGAGWFTGPTLNLAGAPAGTVVTLEVLAFNTSSLNTATVAGTSALFQRTLGGGLVAPASLSGMPNFTVQNVPEPSI